MPGPMAGIRVVELGVWVAAPAAAGILCDWGADVIKIESPKGDPARQWGQILGGDLSVNPPSSWITGASAVSFWISAQTKTDPGRSS